MTEQTQNPLHQSLKPYRSKRQERREAESYKTIQSKYECHKCYDTGWIRPINVRGMGYGLSAWLYDGVSADDIEWCDCELGKEVHLKYKTEYTIGLAQRRQARLERLFHSAGVPRRFLNFELELPDNLINHKVRAYAVCKMMIKEGIVVPARLGEYDHRSVIQPDENIERPNGEFRSVTLSGPKGAGKTVALSVVFRHFLDKGHSGLWIEWFDFAGQVQAGYSRKEGQATPDELIKAAQETDVLLMDDLGDIVKADRKFPIRETDDRRRILWQVIGKRHAEDLTTLVTTNLDADQLYAHFDGRTIDRLFEMSFWCPINGQNLRKVAL